MAILVFAPSALMFATQAGSSGAVREAAKTPLPRVAGCHGPLPIKPGRIYLSCGKAAPVLTSLSWTAWTRSDALAKATLTSYTCSKRCRRHIATSYHAKVALRDPVPAKSGLEFYILTVSYSAQHKVVQQIWINHQLFVAKKKAKSSRG